MEAETIEAIASLLEAIGWPVIVGTSIYFLRQPITRAIASGRQVTMNLAGSEISIGAAAEQQAEHISDLIDKVSLLDNRLAALEDGTALPATEAHRENYPGKKILWVDDTPSNNLQLASALLKLGITVDIAIDTTHAIEKLNTQSYSAIVSDMARPGDDKAGITLATTVRSGATPNVPYFIFCGGWAASNLQQEAAEAGVTRITSSGTQLVSFLREALTDIKATKG